MLSLDTTVVRHEEGQSGASGQEQEGGTQEADSLIQTREKHYAEFCAEVRKGTPIIVVDNANIKEDEYSHLIDFAQQEHYIAAVVTLPAPHDFEVAAQRST